MHQPRPDKLIGVLGTHTEVGKTWVSSQLLRRLRQRGLAVAARKPVQSFEAGDEVTDAVVLASATGESTYDVCPPRRRYALAMAPPMAADILGRPRIELSEIVVELVWPERVDVGVVETAGGAYSPLSHDGDSIDLLRRLRPDWILLVADAGLGAINAVRLSLSCTQPYSTIVFLNRYDERNELHRLNRLWLTERYDIQTVVTLNELTDAVATSI